jgi:hypothetical protein
MIEFVRSRTAMALAVALSALWALGAVLATIAYAVLSQQNAGTTRNLLIGGEWLQFCGGLAALVAVCAVSWQMVLRQRWSDVRETASASLSTLLIVVGLLVGAANAPDDSTASNVLAAVGVGGWMVLTVVRAARYSVEEQRSPSGPRRAQLWLGAAGGLLAIAVGVGLPGPSIQQTALAVVENVISAAGIVALVVALTVGRDRGWIASRHFPILTAGLWTLGASFVVRAILSGIVLGPSATLLGVRLVSALPAGVVALAWAVVGAAAFGKFIELSVSPARGQVVRTGSGSPSTPPPPGWYSSPGQPQSERWWDGAAWTAYERATAPPAPPASPAPPAPAPPWPSPGETSPWAG